MKKLLYLLLIIFLYNNVSLAQNKVAEIPKLTSVIAEFKQSISEKDSTRFKKILLNGNVPFVGIMSSKTEQSIQKDYPEFQGIAISDSRKFMADIYKSNKPQREEFYNIDIDTDGSIASISFDYSYFSGERMIQWGKEKWNLVLIDNTWLITDVVYSIHFPKVEVFPYE